VPSRSLRVIFSLQYALDFLWSRSEVSLSHSLVDVPCEIESVLVAPLLYLQLAAVPPLSQ